MKKITISIIIALIIGAGTYFVVQNSTNKTVVENKDNSLEEETSNPDDKQNQEKVMEESEVKEPETETRIGTSVEDRDIVAYHYGTGDTELLFIGGIHGGYSWNTSLVAYELMDYLDENPDVIPENVKVTVVPVMNPDGLYKVAETDGRFKASDIDSTIDTTSGRFNANNVDLNRNFDCDWQPKGTWQQKTVDAGSKVFSEPESQAIKNYVEKNQPTAVVAWYSSAGGVFASNCHGEVMSETKDLTNLFAKASGYKAYEEFDFYEITGDMVNWLAKNDIPAISVLLTTHKDTEWSKNKAGVEAILNHYSE